MGFKVHLATTLPDPSDPQFSATAASSLVEFSLSTKSFSDLLVFPAPGLARSLQFQSSGAIQDLKCQIRAGSGQLDFSYSGLDADDSLYVWAVNGYRFLSKVWHAEPIAGSVPGAGRAVQCMARCADGKTAPNCVTCRAGGIIARICC